MAGKVTHIENNPEFKGLKVNSGIQNAEMTNYSSIANYKAKKRLVETTVDEFVEKIITGDIIYLSRAITLIESTLPKHQEKAQEIIEKCLPYSGKSIRIGITGVPGAGKSTTIEVLGKYITSKGHKLAVLTIDPSSEKTKGSILGDKTRMEELSCNPRAFIRPSPSSGSLGGVARKTRESLFLCEAAGYDVVFIETIGVGQSETAVYSMIDFFLLILISGAGDELQGIKRGIMEMADMVAINKADGTNVERANLAKAQYSSALQLFPIPESKWKPRVLTFSAIENLRIDELWASILDYIEFTKNNHYFEYRRKEQAKYWLYETINQKLLDLVYQNEDISEKLEYYEKMVMQNKASSFKLANTIIENIKNQHN